MSDSEPVAVGIESSSSMVEQLGKVFIELKSLEDASENKIQWKEIEDYFNNLESSLKKKFAELEEKEKAFVEKESETRALIAEREADVVAKEQASLDRVQVLKEAAVAAILEAREKYKPPSPEPVVNGNAESKVNSSLNGNLDAGVPAPEDSSPHRSREQSMDVDVQPCPELSQNLTQFCEQMDSKGLLNFITENQKHFAAICQELPIALKVANEPARLVLDSLESFYPPVQTDNEDDDQTSNEGNKTDTPLPEMRRSCVMLLESVAPLFEAEPETDDPLSLETKQEAKEIADEWKSKLVETQNSLEAEAFLQLLATFRIASEFDDEELSKLVLAMTHGKKTPDLCRSLGLTDKMPDIIGSLSDTGRQVDAVHLVQAFGLASSFPPVPLLKTYLKDVRRNFQGKGANSGAVGPENDGNAHELAAVRAVIKCIEKYKLEAEYPLEPLKRRLAQLEKSKADKKRSGGTGGTKYQPPPKRTRGNGGYYAGRSSFGAADKPLPPSAYAAGAYMGLPERYPAATVDYQSHSLYGQPASQRSYYYDDRVTPASYGGAPSSYGGYQSYI